MKKELQAAAPLDEAIQAIEKAVETLDEIINEMQKNQATLRSWLEPKTVGWVETKDE